MARERQDRFAIVGMNPSYGEERYRIVDRARNHTTVLEELTDREARDTAQWLNDKLPMLLSEDEVRSLVFQAEALRGQGRFQEAIDLLHSKLSVIPPSSLVDVVMAVHRAAREGKVKDTAVKAARFLLTALPDFPSAETTLKEWGPQGR